MTKHLIKQIVVTSLLLATCLGNVSADTNSANLAAWQSGKYIQLRWNPDSSEEIIGYNIYRSPNLGQSWKKLNTSLFPLTRFVDYSPLQSENVYYKVTMHSRRYKSSTEQESAVATVKIQYNMGSKIHRSRRYKFDKNDIISAKQLNNFSSMTAQQIQDFLSSQGSVLKNFSFEGKRAAQHIYDACQAHKINPKIVLTTLQKEMGLITSSAAEKWRLDFAMGWDPGNRFDSRNFRDQIYWGTKQFRRYYDNLSKYGWSVGRSHKVYDGIVNPVNITAGLYVYTPYIGEKNGYCGNYIFWNIWYNTFQFNKQSSQRFVSSGTNIESQSSKKVKQDGTLREVERTALSVAERTPQSVKNQEQIKDERTIGESEKVDKSEDLQIGNQYIIGKGDVLEITRLQKGEEKPSTVTVQESGVITYPLIGDIMVDGLTTSQIDEKITEELKDYLKDYKVAVVVKEYNTGIFQNKRYATADAVLIQSSK